MLLRTFPCVAVPNTRPGLISAPPEVIRPFRFSVVAVRNMFPKVPQVILWLRLIVGAIRARLKAGIP